MTTPDPADFVNPDPAVHRPGSELGLSGEARNACMECTWHDNGVYVPWPCSVIEPNRRTVAGIVTIADIDAYARRTNPPEDPA